MGNGVAKLGPCFSDAGSRSADGAPAAEGSGDEPGLGHTFSYVRRDPALARSESAKVHHSDESTTTFRAISGAALSANASTPPLSASLLRSELQCSSAASFESSISFSSNPLHPPPRFSDSLSGHLSMSGPLAGHLSMSGPLERGFLSGPLEHRPGGGGVFSGPLDRPSSSSSSTSGRFNTAYSSASGYFYRSLSYRLALRRAARERRTGLRGVARTIIARTVSAAAKLRSMALQFKKTKESDEPKDHSAAASSHPGSVDSGANPTSGSTEAGEESDSPEALQWAQGRAGEDRVHVVVSEEHGWAFVGIYDGFNGPDATDFLLSNLYAAVHRELKGLLWDDGYGSCDTPGDGQEFDPATATPPAPAEVAEDGCCEEGTQRSADQRRRRNRGAAGRWEERQRRWKSEWDKERLELDRKLKEQLSRSSSAGGGAVNHPEVLKALSQALRKTEEAYLDIADRSISQNPELALMGSCVLVMLLRGEDVYLMNVGDSRAVLAHSSDPDLWNVLGKATQNLERIREEKPRDLDAFDHGDEPCLAARQLTLDHSTSVEEEARRIRSEHPDDPAAIVNNRVKGTLKVTRAFGAGFLKQPKWNNALLEMFRINYVGNSPYITCSPFLCHHRLGPQDKFLLLSSDGLYQYFTNEEVVAQVEQLLAANTDADPAQRLVEEVVIRAAKKAGMDLHALLEIPQGDRRRYHDDISIIVISLEGRIWRSSV